MSSESRFTSKTLPRLKRSAQWLPILFKPYIPAYDPFQRWHVRRSAKSLVVVKRWRGLEASSLEAAQLSLLRLLDLQLKTRRSAQLGQHEAAVLLSRTAIDACITGLFCLFVPNAITRLQADNSRSGLNMMQFLKDAGAVSEGVMDAATEAFGEPKRLANPETLLTQIGEHGGPSGARQLYDRAYRPLSSFFVHGTGLALLRHVDRNDRIREKASFPWAKRSAAHTSDACLGLLAALLAGPDHADYRMFNEYADWHWSRVAAVFFAVGGKGVAQRIRPGHVAEGLKSFIQLVDYLDSPQVWEDSLEVKRESIREGFVGMFDVIGVDHDGRIVDAFVEMIVESFSTPQ
jgi:hypothetical protein